MSSAWSRRAFLQRSAVLATGLALGPRFWARADDGSPFGPLEPDPLLKLPEGFSYQVVAETGIPLTGGARPYVRPNFPDLNVVFPQSDGSVLLSTSHEVPSIFPLLTPPPDEDYDAHAGGAVSTLHLRDVGGLLVVDGGIYNAGGMLMNCSGSGTPWGTVLTGEEDTTDGGGIFEADHGFVWEVDPSAQGKVRLDALGRFDHETAVVDGQTGIVYLTEDSSPGLLYRFLPDARRRLAEGGVLQAFARDDASGTGSWVTIDDPLGQSGQSPAQQGLAKGALAFSRLEGGRFDPLDRRWFYFTETENPTDCGRVWRLNVRSGVLDLWASPGSPGGADMCMPDNLEFDAAGNIFLAEDNGAAGPLLPNRVLFVDRESGEVHVFAELVHHWQTPDNPGNVADEPTGPAFWHRPDGTSVLFLNLQRAAPLMGLTLAISGPFAAPNPARRGRAAAKAHPRGS